MCGDKIRPVTFYLFSFQREARVSYLMWTLKRVRRASGGGPYGPCLKIRSVPILGLELSFKNVIKFDVDLISKSYG